MILKVTNVRLEAVGGPHLDGGEVMIVLLEFMVRRVLSEEQLSEISEAVN